MESLPAAGVGRLGGVGAVGRLVLWGAVMVAAASATTHPPPPWRRVVRAIQHGNQPYPQLSEQMQQQAQQQMENMRQHWLQQWQQQWQQMWQQRRDQKLQQFAPAAGQPQWQPSQWQPPQYQQPQYQMVQEVQSAQPRQTAAPLQEQQSDWRHRSLTENLGSSFLRDMHKFSEGHNVQPPVLQSGEVPRPYHHGVAKVAIAQTNHDFAVPQDPSVVGNLEAIALEAIKAISGKANPKTNSTERIAPRTGTNSTESITLRAKPADPPTQENIVDTEGSSDVHRQDGLKQPNSQGSARASKGVEPSKCVFAIVSCCMPQTDVVRPSCFELLGCPGPFWDVSPCQKEVAAKALQAVLKYYNSATTMRPPRTSIDDYDDDYLS